MVVSLSPPTPHLPHLCSQGLGVGVMNSGSQCTTSSRRAILSGFWVRASSARPSPCSCISMGVPQAQILRRLRCEAGISALTTMTSFPLYLPVKGNWNRGAHRGLIGSGRSCWGLLTPVMGSGCQGIIGNASSCSICLKIPT